MKIIIALIVAALALNVTLASPARDLTEDAEVISGPRRVSTKTDNDYDDFKGVIDTGSGYPFLQSNPSTFSFNLGFFDSFEDILRRLRARLWPLAVLGGADSDESDVNLNIDPEKVNKTSTVKVVDGHRVEINDTVYGDDHSVFKVRVINVRPLESDENDEDVKKTVVTYGPETNINHEAHDSHESREPMDKRPQDNEIRGDIDNPEKEVKLPEKGKLNGQFYVDISNVTSYLFFSEFNLPKRNHKNNIKLQIRIDMASEEDFQTLSDNNNNNNKNNIFNDENESEASGDDGIDAMANEFKKFGIRKVFLKENKFNTARENISSSESESGDGEFQEMSAQFNAEWSDLNQDDDNVKAEIEASGDDDTNDNIDKKFPIKKPILKQKNIPKKDRENTSSSSDDDDEDSTSIEMSAQFNDEWNNINQINDNFIINKINTTDKKISNDLSNDIIVNDIAANQLDFSLNPDAEYIDSYDTAYGNHMISSEKYDKLTLNDDDALK